jgi:hypothetical protein
MTRHPGITSLLGYLDCPHLPEDLRRFTEPLHRAGVDLSDLLPDSPELTAGLRKLVEAKDCLIRAAIDAR